MKDSRDPRLNDVSRLTAECWRNVSQASIARSWVKAKIMPAAVKAALNNQ